MRDWKKLSEREHKTDGALWKYFLMPYFQGKYYQMHEADEPDETRRRAAAIAYGFAHLPVSIGDDQEFLGGWETHLAVEKPDWLEQKDYDDAIKAAERHPLRPYQYVVSHVIPDYETLLHEGFAGLLERAKAGEAANGTPCAKAMVVVAQAYYDFFTRAAAELQSIRPEVSARLLRGRDGRVADLADAIQLVWLTHILLRCEVRHANALGRIDQYFYPYYQKGGADYGETLYYLCSLFSLVEGMDETTNMCIGGVKPDGSNAENDLSLIVLDAVKAVHSKSTNLSARLHDNSTDEFLRGCVDCIRTGIGFPSVFNDNITVKTLVSSGFPVEAARDVAFVGCVEAFIPGCQAPWTDARFNMPQVACSCFDRLEEFNDFEELLDEFRRQMDISVQKYCDDYSAQYASYRIEEYPDPMMSLFIRGCIDSGKDVNDGGPIYPRIHGVGMMGLGTLTDSFAAVRKLVFQEGRIGKRELVEALRNDFANAEELRQTLVNCAPKYGNDDAECDELARQITAICTGATRTRRIADGGFFQPCMASNIQNISGGREVPATPNGRHAGAPLSDAASPSHGQDRHGPTAFLNSVLKPDYEYMNCTVVNMRFAPEIFDNEKGVIFMVALLRRFVAGGGHELQFNVTSNDTLRKAIANPEEYQDLLVRVSGFSAFFTRLRPDIQQDILRRTSHGLSAANA